MIPVHFRLAVERVHPDAAGELARHLRDIESSIGGAALSDDCDAVLGQLSALGYAVAELERRSMQAPAKGGDA